MLRNKFRRGKTDGINATPVHSIAQQRRALRKAVQLWSLEHLENRRLLTAVVTTDQADYAPGSTAVFTATTDGGATGNFQAGETIHFHIDRTDGIPIQAPPAVTDFNVVDGSTTAAYQDAAGMWWYPDVDGQVNGAVQANWYVDPQFAGASLSLSGTGLTSGATAQTTFTDTNHLDAVVVAGQSPNAIAPGSSATYAVSFASHGSGPDLATLSVISGLPTGASASFSPNPVDVTGTSTLTISTTGLTPVGTFTFTVQAVADATKTTPATLVVKKASTPTITSASVNPSSYGQAVSFTTTVTGTGGTPTGTVQFQADGVNFGSAVTLSSGTATSPSISTLAAGSHTITAVYSGDTNFAGATSAGFTQTVNKLAVALTGTRTYDATTAAAAAILTISNNLDGVNLTLSGSGTLASKNVGSQAISAGTLALGGSAAGNYTLTGLSGSVTVNALAVALTGTRTYDATTAAAAAILTISNNLDGVNLTLSGSGTLASKNVGSQIISAGTLALGGSAAGNYTLTGLSGSVTVNALAVALAGTRTYDATTAAAAAILTISNNLDGVNLTLSGSGTLASKNVGSQAISAGTLALGGSAAGNYTLTGLSGSVTVNKLAVALTGTRIYDATTAAAAAILTISNNLDGVNLTLSGNGTLASKNVGSQAISAGTLALGGSAAGNYTLTGLSGSVTVNKLAVALTGTRIYDATTAAAAAILTISNNLDGVNLTLSGSGTLASKNVGSQAISAGTLALGGSAAGNYTLTGLSGSVSVTTLAVTLTGARAYDGTATAAAAILTISNNLDGVNLTLSGSGTLASKNVGSQIISAGTLALGGSAAGNYTLTGLSGSVTVNALAVALAGTRTYDATTAAAAAILTISNNLDGVNLTLSGSGTLASKNVGSQAISAGTLALGGSAAGNYTLTGLSGSVTVNKLAVALTGTRIYDATTAAAAAILTISNNLDGVNLTLSGNGTLASKNVGSQAISAGTLALGGSAAGNYTLTGLSGSVSVTTLAVTLTGARAYDGTATAAAAILTISNNLDGVNLTLSGNGTLASKNVGSEAISSFAGLTLGGTSASNYTLTGASGAVTVNTAALSITANADSKTYGQAKAYGTGQTTFASSGLQNGETVGSVTIAASGGTAANAAVGSYTLTASAATGGTFTASNYTITYNTGTLTVNQLAVTLTGSRIYDGTTSAAAAILTVSNKVSGDNLTLSGSATLASKNVGSEAISSFAGLTLGGTSASNYTLTGASGSVSIATATLTITSLTPPIATEGASTGTILVAKFASNGGADVTQYTATITWGDGGTSTGGIVDNHDGTFGVNGSHAYGEEATGLTFDVQVNDTGGSTVHSNASINVSDAALSVMALIPPVATEGAALTSAVVFHFTDADPAAVAGDYAATVQTGDATLTSAANPTNVQVVANGNGFDVQFSYTYAEELTNKTFSVSVSDAGGASASASTNTFSVADAALTAGALTPPVATEGAAFSNTTVFHFTDADPNGAASDYSALVTRGDGTSVTLTSTAGANGQIVPHTGGGFDVQMSYTYAEELSGQTFSVVVTDHASTASASTSTFGVIDPAVTVNANSGGTLTAINEATATAANTVVGTFTDSGNPTGTLDSDQTSIKPEYKAVIAWGDGNTTTLDTFNNASAFVSTGGGTFQVKAPAHTYAEEGSYNISLTVTHDALSAVGPTQTATITVADPAVSVTGVAVSATEGLAFTGASVATFADPAGAEAADGTHYSASINWGDGTAASTGTITLSGGTFTVKGDHTYAEEGSFTVTTTVNHEGVITAATSTATVADSVLTASTAANALTATEGAASGTLVVATFTDADPAAAAGDYSGTIHWGDGQSSAFTSADVSVVSATTFNISGSHTYAEEGPYSVTVDINDAGGATTTAANTTFSVADAQLTTLATAAMPTGKLEGADIGAVSAIAAFTDPAGAGVEPLSDFTATINWGDGTTSVGSVASLGGGNYRVDALAGHTYVEEGTYTVNVTLKHDALGAVTTPDKNITIADAPLAAGTLTPPLATEGAAFSNTTVLHFTDAAGASADIADYTATVTLGDGNAVTLTSTPGANGQIVANGDGYDVQLSHTYAEELTNQTFGVSVSDVGGASTSASTSTFNVSDAALTGSSTATAGGTEGALNSSVLTAATFTDANLGDHSTDFTATINWGDNTTPTVGTVSYNSGTYSVLGTHTYAEEGTYTLGISVLDAGGQTATLTGTATVADAALTAGTLTPPVATEGAAFSNTTVLHFTDAAGSSADIADYSALVTLGDGTSVTLTSTAGSNGQIVANGDGYDVQLSYIYGEEIKAAANASFTVQVTDAGGAPTIAATSTPFTVADAALTVTTVTHPASTEGISTGTVTVATFTDAAGTYSDLADLTATITWADGSTSPGMIAAIPGPAGHYSVTASHTYTEEINSASDFTVSVSDSGGSGNALTIHTATVADAPLTAGTLTPPVATEGAAFANTTVLHFTDAAAASADIADYTATVTLGDGNTVNLTSTPSANGQIIANGDGYDVQLSYTYAEELTNKTFGVSVADAGGASTSASTGTFNVADAALTAGTLTPPIATEGAGFSNVTVFHFTDADPAAVPGDYVATVQTGDATLTSAANPGNVHVVAASGGGFDVQLSYTYAEELSNQTFSVSVTDNEGGSGTGLRSATSASTNTFSVADAALTPSTAANALTATEGAATGNQIVATFTDADPAAVAGDYSGTIHWGDGQSSAFTSADVSLVLATTFNISGSHTYAEEGPYSVTVDINDAGGATTTAANTTFSVADAQLTNLASANLPANGQEGAALAAITSIATFTDPAGVGAETASGDFTATINWGDTTTSAGTVVSLGGGNYQVNAPAHTYAEEGVYSVNVSVTHDALATLTTPDQSITVADAPLTAGALTPAVTTEGTAFSNVTVFHFSDADPAGTASDFLATVQTGDATLTSAANPANVQIVAASGGGFDVQLSYTYAEELSNQTFSVSVTDNSATASASTGTFNVADQQLTGLSSANLPVNGQEGAALAAITGLATFTDPAGAEAVGDYIATINWGDTTTSTGTVVYTSGNNFSVDAPSHTYAEEGSYNVTVTLTHDLLAPVTTPTQSIAVADAALTAGVLTPPVATEGAAFSNVTVFHFTDADPLGTASDYTALITLGNGNAVTLTSASSANGQILANVNGGFDVQLSYTYAEELTNQTFSVSVTDSGGASTSASTTTFSVADAALTANSFTPPLATEGASFSGTVLNFSDSDPSGSASDYTALLTLGDGNTVTLAASAGADGQIVAHGDGTFDVNLSHTYAEELSGQTFGVSVSDNAATASASTNTFSVADAALTAGALTPPVATEGSPITNAVLFHFSDADPNGTASDYTATVTWGDGSVDHSNDLVSVVSVVPSGGGFDVVASHTYLEEAAGLTFGVSVIDNEGGSGTGPRSATSASTNTFSVADAALTSGTTANPLTATEGASSGTWVVATFTDADPAAAAGDYSGTIHWGDGQSSAFTSADVSLVSATTFNISGSHTYSEEGSYSVTVDINDAGGATTTAANTTFSVADAQLTTLATAAMPTGKLEGADIGPISGIATFTDPAGVGNETASGDFTATINWGDNNTSAGTIVSLGNGNYRVDAPAGHTYAEEGTYSVNVTLTHDLLAPVTTPDQSIGIADAPLTAGSLTPPVATEGAPFSNVVIFHFSDADPAGTASDYLATVQTGDATLTSAANPANVKVVPHVGGGFDVTLSYTYAEELSGQTFGVSVSDAGGVSTSASTTTFSVADAALTANSFTPPLATEGAPFSGTVLNFSDADPSGTASDYTALLTLGDGNTVTLTASAGADGQIVAHGDGTFDVNLSHTYAEELSGQTFGVSVIDNEGGSGTGPRSATSASTNTFSVADAALTSGTTANPLTATEGASSGTWVVATFTDADPAAAAGDYSGTIHWGDGQSSAFTSADVSLVSATTFNISGSHTYSEEGSYSVTVDINDAGGATTTAANTTFSVADAQLTTLATAAMPTGKLEGADIGPISGIATFTDPAGVGNETASGDFTATINWGDNNTSAGTIVSLGNGNYRVDAPAGHTYAEEGTYSVNVTLTHDLLAPVTTPDQSIGIADAPLTAGSLTPPVATEGAPFSNVVIFHFSDADPAGTASDYLATVQTGDATLTSAANPANVKVVPHVGGGFDVTLSYTYAEELSGQTFGVSVSDAGGVSTSASTTTFSVADAALTANSFTPPLATEGAPFSGTVLNFSDADPSGIASDYTALLTLGDGNTVTLTASAGADGQIVAHGDGTFDVNLSHTYAEELTNKTFSVSVSDAGGASASASTNTFSVADAALTAGALTPPVATEGAAFSNTTVFHFTDADPNGAASDYSALVTRGDGTSVTLTSTAGANGQIVPHTGGGFDVQMSYTYAEELSGQTFSVVVTDHASTASASTSTFGVIDPAVTVNANSGGTLTAINEATATAANTVVGTFTDSGNPTGTLDSDQTSIKPEYKAVIAWGDGNTTTLDTFNNASAFVSTGGGTFQVKAPAHTYAEEGSYNISLTVTHDALSAVGPTQTATITVADPAVSVTGVAVSATEGLAFTGASVATFADPAGAEAADGTHYSASINWGDGTAASTGTITLSGGTFTVKGDHTYAEEGSFTVTTTVNHEGVITAATSTATVADSVLTASTAANALTATEGAASGTLVVATFTDADPAAAAGDYSGTIHWGDGQSSAFTSADVSVVSATTFNISGSHTYAEEGPYSVTVDINDAGGATTTAANTTFSVADAQLTTLATAAMPTGKLEGADIGAVSAIAAFTDPAGAGVEPLSDFTATINWGDGTTSVGSVASLGGGNYRVDALAGHTYVEEGTYTVNVTLKHDALGAVTTPDKNITIADAPLAAGTLTPPLATEGAAFSNTTVLHFTDAAGASADIADYTATVTLGDGNAVTLTSTPGANGQIVANGDGYDVQLSHTYAEELTNQTFGVSVSDVGGASTSASTSTFNVSDAALTGSSTATAGGTEGALNSSVLTAATFTDANLGDHSTDFTATINWGDNTTPTVGTVSYNSGTYSVLGTHTYAEEGTYTLGISVLDAGGQTATLTGTATVADAALTAGTLTPPVATEGAAFSNTTVLHFTDAAGSSADIADYSALVTLGDGTSVTLTSTAGSNGQIVANGDGYDVQLSYIYGEEIKAAANASFTVQVTDAGGAPTIAATSTPFTVADAALTVTTVTHPASTEGISTGTVTVATFTDAAGTYSDLADLTATITWADGSTSPGMIAAIPGPAGHYSVTASHTYTEEINSASDFTVSVSDSGGSGNALTIHTATVADAPLTAGTLTPPVATEGAAFANTTVLHFTDAAAASADIADYTATVTLGDGNTVNLTSTPSANGQIIANGDGYDVQLSYTYAEELTNKTFGVSVADAGGASTGASTSTFNVADAALTGSSAATAGGTEGALNSSVLTAATFTDANPGDHSADFTATINWGDNTAPTLGTVSYSSGTYSVLGTHTYAEEGTYALGIAVLDAGGLTAALTGTATVADAPLTAGTLTPPVATEGAAFSNVVVFHFSDADPAAVPGDYVATVQTGDATLTSAANPGNVHVVAASGGGFDVQLSYTYAEELSGQTFSVSVTDSVATASASTGTFSVADAALTANSFTPPLATEGASFSGTVLNFSDADPSGIASDYTALLTLGDGNTVTLTSTSGADGQIVAHGDGTFDVNLSHTYAEELSGQTFGIVVTDHASQTGSSISTFSVADAALTAGTLTAPTAIEGAAFANTTVFHFTDADPLGTASDYTATVTLGDGNTVTLTSTASASGQIVANGNGFDVQLSYTYAEELTNQTFGVSVTDGGGASTSASTTTFSVSDAALTAGALTPPTATEGSPITNAVLFHFSDADPNRTASDYTATVTWGDGTVDHSNDLVSVVSVVPSGGGFDVVASHTYLEEAAGLTFGVSVSDHTATAAASINTFSVADAALTGSSTATAAGTEGALNSSVLTAATFTDANLGDHSTDFTATINWGDNTTPTVGTVSYNSGTYSVLGTHTYAEEGTYSLGISVLDAGGQTATLTGTATVADAALTAGTLAPPTASEGAAFSNVVVFHFSDADPAALAGDYVATVQTGDATLTSAVNPGNVHVVAASGGGFDVQLSYTYVEELTSTIFSVSVIDNEGGSGTGLRSATSASTNTFSVADQQLTSLATATMPTGKLEGADIGAITGIATFTDPAGLGVEPLGDFTATINWGDTNTSPGTVVSLGGGNYRVDTSGHTYAEEGLYTVNVTLKHDALTALTTPDKTITIADAPLSSTAANLTPPVATEGAAFTNTTVFHFTDADPAAAANDYTALVTLGDGNTLTLTSANGQIVASGNGFDVQLSYTYVEELSNQTFGVSVTDNEGGSGTGIRSATAATTTTFSVADAQLTSLASANLPANGLEGAALAAISGIATFTDPAGAEAVSDYTATINWGDTTTSTGTVVSLGGGNYRIDAPTHTYTEEGTYSVNVTVKHDALATVTTPTQGISVADAALSSTAANLTPPVATEGPAFSNVVVFHFTDADPAGTASDYVATVQTGDATLTSAANPANVQVVAHTGGGFDVTLSYTYAEELSNQTFAVSVTDHSATTSQTLSTFSVTDAQLTNLVSANLPANGQEGAALAAISGIATFTDPAGVEAVSDYTATINWGDTTTSTGTVVHTTGNNFRVDAPVHSYAEEGSYNVTVTLKHDALGTLTTPTQNIVIADQQLTSLATATMPTGTVEGAAIGAITGIATFTDPAGAEAVGDYTATINWGDTTTSVGTVVSLGGGNYRVDALTHTYAEEGVYNVNVTLKHDALATVTTPTQGITVADAALTAGTLTPPVATEGAAFSNVTVFHFTDADPAAAASDYSALVTLGDGTSVTLTSTASAKGQIVAHSGGGFNVQLSYTYVEEFSNQTFSVSVTDNEGGSGTGSRSTTGASTASFSVADAQLTSLASANLPASGQEGAALATITGIATFTDPAGAGVEPLGDYTATINWGDTTTSPGTIVSLSGGNYRVDAPAHTYAEEGTFTVNVTLKHDALATLNTPNRTIAIADAPLTAGALTPPLATEGAPFSNTIIFHFSDADPAAVAGDYLATVQTGDATRTSAANPTNVQIVAASGGGFDVKLSYTYAEELSGQTFSVSVTDNEGGSGSGSRSTTGATNNSFSVADAQLTSLASANLPTTGQEGATVAAITGVASFTDPAGVGSEPLSDFTATINWGDASTSVGTVVSLSSGNYRVDAPTHIYAGEGTYTVNVTLRHDALSPLTTPNQSIAIADAPLTASALALSQTYGADPGSQTVAQFQDTGGAEALNNYSAMINWGDGTAATPGTISYNSGTHTFSVSGDHPYQAAGQFQATTTISHDTAPNAVVISTITVAKATTAVSVSSSTGTNSAFDQTITFTATVGPVFMAPVSSLPTGGGTPTGQVQFLINGVVVGTSTLSGGKATFTTTALQLGQNSITVKYLGDNNFLGGVSANPLMQFSSAGILLLDPTGSNALSVSGNGKVVVNNASIVVDSSSATAVSDSGNGSITAAIIDDHGGITDTGNAQINGTVLTKQPTVLDPLAALSAPVASTLIVRSTSTYMIAGSQSVVLNPGVYIGGIQISGQAMVTLNPGIYYMQGGGFTVSGNATVTDLGRGVLIYNGAAINSNGSAGAVGQISFSGNCNVLLSAMASGPYQGLSIFQDRTSTSAMTFSGNGNITITGTIYAVKAMLTLSGNDILHLGGSSLDLIGAELITADLNVSGNASLIVTALA